MQGRYLSAAEAVRTLSKASSGEAEARRLIARQCRDGSLVALARREMVRVSVSVAHRERFRLEEIQTVGRTLLDPMNPFEAHQDHVEIGALFWRDAFDENGDLRAEEQEGALSAMADWRLGNFTTIHVHRMPVLGWEGDRGDYTEVRVLGVRFLADGLTLPKAEALPPPKRKLPEAALLRWWGRLTPVEKDKSQRKLWDQCLADNEGYLVTRQRIRELASGRKPGPRSSL